MYKGLLERSVWNIGNIALGLAGISATKGDPEHTPKMLSDVAGLFDWADYSGLIVCKELPDPIFSSAPVSEALDQALERGCTIEAIVGPQAEEAAINDWLSHGISVYKLDEPPESPFALVDGTYARIEVAKVYSDLPEGEIEQCVIRGRFKKNPLNGYKNAFSLSQEFEELKQKATNVGLEYEVSEDDLENIGQNPDDQDKDNITVIDCSHCGSSNGYNLSNVEVIPGECSECGGPLNIGHLEGNGLNIINYLLLGA